MISLWALTCVGLMATMVAIYIIWVRPYLKSLPSLSDSFDREQNAWDAFKAWLKGRKTIIVGLWGEIIGLGPDVLQQVSGLDLKHLLSLPDLWAAWVTAMIPILMIMLRSQSPKA